MDLVNKEDKKKIRIELKKPAGIIGYYFWRYENDLSVWHKIKTDAEGEQEIIETMKINKE